MTCDELAQLLADQLDAVEVRSPTWEQLEQIRQIAEWNRLTPLADKPTKKGTR